MSILSANRPHGKREPLCVGEEASVSLIRSRNRHDGMVERLQEIGIDPGKGNTAGAGSFIFYLSNGQRVDDYLVPSTIPHYHVLRYLSLRFAKNVFPDNFIDAHEMRIFKKGGRRYAGLYSDFIPDTSGVMARRREAMLRYYDVDDTLRQSIRESLDAEVRCMNPRLAEDIAAISAAGIGIPHPEANHHLSQGGNVFFEVEGIDLPKAIQAGRGGKGTDYLALIYAVFLKLVARNISMESFDQDGAIEFCKAPLVEVYGFIRQIMLDDKFTNALLKSWVGAVKFGTEHWKFSGASAARNNEASVKPDGHLPCRISIEALGLLEDSTGRCHLAHYPNPRK